MDSMEDRESEEDVANDPCWQLMDEAQVMLDKYRLQNAEEIFVNIIKSVVETTPKRDELLIRALTGLADSNHRRGNSTRDNMEWHFLYVQAISLYHKAIEQCDRSHIGARRKKRLWLCNKRKVLNGKLRVLEDCFMRSLYEFLLTVGRTHESQAGSLWLADLQAYCVKKIRGTPEKEENGNHKSAENTTSEQQTTEDTNDTDDSSNEEQRRDFEITPEKISAIRSFVTHKMEELRATSDLTAFSRLQKSGKLSKATMIKLSPTIEKLSPLASQSQRFITDIFAKRLKMGSKPDSSTSDSAEDIPEEDGICDKIDQLSPMSEGSDVWEYENRNDMSPGGATDSHDFFEGSERRSSSSPGGLKSTNGRRVPNGNGARNKLQIPSLDHNGNGHVETKTIVIESGAKEDHRTGIMRILRGNGPEDIDESDLSPDPGDCGFETFQERSPITESFRFDFSRESLLLSSSSSEEGATELKSPVTEQRMHFTLAQAIMKLADKLVLENRYKDAIHLFERAFVVLQDIKDESNQGMVRTAKGNVLKNLGIIKCKEGDVMSGYTLMHQAMKHYSASGETDSKFHVASTWLELGIAFLSLHFEQNTLAHQVMGCLQEELDEDDEEADEKPEFTRSDEDDSDDDEDDDREESYNVSVSEATTCFSHAISIMRVVQFPDDADDYHCVLAQSLTRLGDCSVAVGDYDRAVQYYEEALDLFRKMFGSTSLPENAHVMSMLGVANFLLHNYPKAAAMFDCAHVIHNHVYGADDATFEMAFTLSLLGITYYSMKQHYRSIAWCLKAFEIYTRLHKDHLITLEPKKMWIVVQTLFTLGYSYSTVNFFDKSIHYLLVARALLVNMETPELKQLVRVLRTLADTYSTMEENESALQYYEEALSYVADKGSRVLQNQLLNSAANVHVTMKDYQNAAENLEKALELQKTLEDDIKGDLVSMLHQLGIVHTLDCDVDRAIDCYVECLDQYKETHGPYGPEMSATLANLASMYHVKATTMETEHEKQSFMNLADQYFKEAMELELNSNVTVRYANFLIYQGKYDEAAISLDDLLRCDHEETEVIYSPLEFVILLERLQMEPLIMEDCTLPSSIMAKFLIVLCFARLQLYKFGEDPIVNLYKDVTRTSYGLFHSLLGYALMAMKMYPEAAYCFGISGYFQEDKTIANENYGVAWILHLRQFVIDICFRVWDGMSSKMKAKRKLEMTAIPTNTDEWKTEQWSEEKAVSRETETKVEEDENVYEEWTEETRVPQIEKEDIPQDEVVYDEWCEERQIPQEEQWHTEEWTEEKPIPQDDENVYEEWTEEKSIPQDEWKTEEWTEEKNISEDENVYEEWTEERPVPQEERKKKDELVYEEWTEETPVSAARDEDVYEEWTEETKMPQDKHVFEEWSEESRLPKEERTTYEWTEEKPIPRGEHVYEETTEERNVPQDEWKTEEWTEEKNVPQEEWKTEEWTEEKPIPQDEEWTEETNTPREEWKSEEWTEENKIAQDEWKTDEWSEEQSTPIRDDYQYSSRNWRNENREPKNDHRWQTEEWTEENKIAQDEWKTDEWSEEQSTPIRDDYQYSSRNWRNEKREPQNDRTWQTEEWTEENKIAQDEWKTDEWSEEQSTPIRDDYQYSSRNWRNENREPQNDRWQTKEWTEEKSIPQKREWTEEVEKDSFTTERPQSNSISAEEFEEEYFDVISQRWVRGKKVVNEFAETKNEEYGNKEEEYEEVMDENGRRTKVRKGVEEESCEEYTTQIEDTEEVLEEYRDPKTGAWVTFSRSVAKHAVTLPPSLPQEEIEVGETKTYEVVEEEYFDTATGQWVNTSKTVTRDDDMGSSQESKVLRTDTIAATAGSQGYEVIIEEYTDPATGQWVTVEKIVPIENGIEQEKENDSREYEEVLDDITGQWVRVYKTQSHGRVFRENNNNSFRRGNQRWSDRDLRYNSRGQPIDIESSPEEDENVEWEEYFDEKTGQWLKRTVQLESKLHRIPTYYNRTAKLY